MPTSLDSFQVSQQAGAVPALTGRGLFVRRTDFEALSPPDPAGHSAVPGAFEDGRWARETVDEVRRQILEQGAQDRWVLASSPTTAHRIAWMLTYGLARTQIICFLARIETTIIDMMSKGRAVWQKHPPRVEWTRPKDADNKEVHKAYSKAYREQHQDQIRMASMNYRLAHRDEILEKDRRYQRARRQKGIETQAAGRSRQRA